MCLRNNFVCRRIQSVGQNVPKNAVEMLEDFLQKMQGQFVNLASMDEMLCYFDVSRSSTI